jgi:anti-anti-sigma factor
MNSAYSHGPAGGLPEAAHDLLDAGRGGSWRRQRARMDLEHFSREVLMIPFEPFSVRGERSGQRHRLTPVGELDLATVPVLEREFNAALLGDADTIVVDLGQLEFLDSSGIGALLPMDDACGGRTGRLRVILGSHRVERVLEIAGVRERLSIVASEGDSLAGG